MDNSSKHLRGLLPSKILSDENKARLAGLMTSYGELEVDEEQGEFTQHDIEFLRGNYREPEEGSGSEDEGESSKIEVCPEVAREVTPVKDNIKAFLDILFENYPDDIININTMQTPSGTETITITYKKKIREQLSEEAENAYDDEYNKVYIFKKLMSGKEKVKLESLVSKEIYNKMRKSSNVEDTIKNLMREKMGDKWVKIHLNKLIGSTLE